jgi:hypothetical protein
MTTGKSKRQGSNSSKVLHQVKEKNLPSEITGNFQGSIPATGGRSWNGKHGLTLQQYVYRLSRADFRHTAFEGFLHSMVTIFDIPTLLPPKNISCKSFDVKPNSFDSLERSRQWVRN